MALSSRNSICCFFQPVEAIDCGELSSWLFFIRSNVQGNVTV